MMKTTTPAFALFFLAMASAFQFAAAEKVILIDEQFEEPNGRTTLFPPAEGSEFAYVTKTRESLVSAWSVDGQMAITYAEKVGTKESGGLDCKLEVAGGLYANVTIESIPFPEVNTSASLTPELVNTLAISFSAKIPNGDEIELALGPVLPLGSGDDFYANRLVFPIIKGTGSYETYTFAVMDLPPAQVEGFCNVLKNALTGGADKASFNFSLTLGKQWSQGASFQLDDVLITLEK